MFCKACKQERLSPGEDSLVLFKFCLPERVGYHVGKAGKQPVGRLGELQMKILEWGIQDTLENCKVNLFNNAL